MSGFLAALIARADGRLPVLQRRERALFEPTVGTAVGGFAARDDEARASAHAAPHAVRDDTSSRPERQHDRASPSPSRAQDASSRLPHPGLPAPIAVAAVVRPAGVERQESRTARAAAILLPDALPAPRAPQPDADADGAPSLDRSRIEAARALEGSPRTEPRTTEPAPPLGSLQPRAAALAPSTAWRARSSAPTAPRRDALPAAPPTPAPVRISIGRVEIRAVHAATEKPRAVGPAAPKLSLDDYLRARNGAAR